MTDWEGRKTAYSYDENGRLVETTRADGTVETRAYDKAGSAPSANAASENVPAEEAAA